MSARKSQGVAEGVIDELAVRRATAELRRIAKLHPEAFAPDRLPQTEAALAAVLGERRKGGRPPTPNAGVTYTVRLPPALIERLALVAQRRGIAPRVMVREWIEQAVAEAER